MERPHVPARCVRDTEESLSNAARVVRVGVAAAVAVAVAAAVAVTRCCPVVTARTVAPINVLGDCTDGEGKARCTRIGAKPLETDGARRMGATQPAPLSNPFRTTSTVVHPTKRRNAPGASPTTVCRACGAVAAAAERDDTDDATDGGSAAPAPAPAAPAAPARMASHQATAECSVAGGAMAQRRITSMLFRRSYIQSETTASTTTTTGAHTATQAQRQELSLLAGNCKRTGGIEQD